MWILPKLLLDQFWKAWNQSEVCFWRGPKTFIQCCQGIIQHPVAIKIFCIVFSGPALRKLHDISNNWSKCVRTSLDLDLKLLKITLVKFTYPTQCPKVPPLSHCSFWVWPRPDECHWDFLTFAVGTSSSLYGCSNKLIGSEENIYVSLSCVALILRWTRHLTRGILTKYAEVLNFKTLDACCWLDSCKTKENN